MVENLVLKQDLVDHLLWAADEVRAAQPADASKAARAGGGQPRSRPMRFIVSPKAGRSLGRRLRRLGDEAVRVDAEERGGSWPARRAASR